MSAAITSKAISNVSKLLRKLIVLGLTLAFLLACWKLAVAVEKLPDTLSDDFVNIELAITAIAVDVRYFGEDNFLGASVDGYQAEKVYLSRAAAEALGLVQADLQNFGLGLKVFDGYRPQVAVDHFVRWAQDLDDTRMKQAYYPAVAKQNLFRDGYIERTPAADKKHGRGHTKYEVSSNVVGHGSGLHRRSNQVREKQP